MKPPPRRVLVIVTRRIGDVLLATPVWRSLKRAWPDAAVDALVFSSTAGVLAGNPDVRRVLAIPERPGLWQHAAFIAKLFRRYDLALSLLPGDRPSLYAYFAGKKRAGLLQPTRKEQWKQRLFHQWVAFDPHHRHMVRTYLSLLAPLGVPAVAEITPGQSASDDSRVMHALSPLQADRYVVLHLYPKFNYKMWHDAGWTALAQWISERGLRVVLTGSNERAERDYVQRLAANMQDPLNLAGRLSLQECATILVRAAAYVGPDTALTHMAAALGVPTVALFGPTDPLCWGPWPKDHGAGQNPWQRLGDQSCRNVRVVQGTAACAPCGHEGCERHVASYSDCLLTLSADRVIQALKDVAAIG